MSCRISSIRPQKGRWLAAYALAALCVLPMTASAQGAEGELVRLVDNPTAGLVDKGRFAVDMRMFPEGGLVGQLQAGIMRRLTIGLSFGGEGVIGNDAIDESVLGCFSRFEREESIIWNNLSNQFPRRCIFVI